MKKRSLDGTAVAHPLPDIDLAQKPVWRNHLDGIADRTIAADHLVNVVVLVAHREASSSDVQRDTSPLR
ncbi:hypothetical protein [Burkholderia ambifaria]|uniref:hypothetical protein n=1 Tax=Burkholderia ambifaria TaxID=152480 RepID=UPI0012FD72DB|nr:hypothetical protein [Burkholderia ambifaria]